MGEKILQSEQKQIRHQINEEMSHVSFSGKDKVLQKTHPITWTEKLGKWLNKEITIPLVPVSVASLLLITALLFPAMLLEDDHHLPTREIVEVGGNYYWSDLFEEVRNK